MRDFPVGPATPLQAYVQIPVDRQGRPKTESRQWKTMLANAMAREPADRSPAERTAVRRAIEGVYP
jgi:hypothetical protein